MQAESSNHLVEFTCMIPSLKQSKGKFLALLCTCKTTTFFLIIGVAFLC